MSDELSDEQRNIRLKEAFVTLEALSAKLDKRPKSFEEADALLTELYRKRFGRERGEGGERPEQKE